MFWSDFETKLLFGANFVLGKCGPNRLGIIALAPFSLVFELILGTLPSTQSLAHLILEHVSGRRSCLA